MSSQSPSSSSSSSERRRRQREDEPNTPHHVMTQPVFLQKILPFACIGKNDPIIFNSVSPSWSDTLIHYHGATACWCAFFQNLVDQYEQEKEEHEEEEEEEEEEQDFLHDYDSPKAVAARKKPYLVMMTHLKFWLQREKNPLFWICESLIEVCEYFGFYYERAYFSHNSLDGQDCQYMDHPLAYLCGNKTVQASPRFKELIEKTCSICYGTYDIGISCFASRRRDRSNPLNEVCRGVPINIEIIQLLIDKLTHQFSVLLTEGLEKEPTDLFTCIIALEEYYISPDYNNDTALSCLCSHKDTSSIEALKLFFEKFKGVDRIADAAVHTSMDYPFCFPQICFARRQLEEISFLPFLSNSSDAIFDFIEEKFLDFGGDTLLKKKLSYYRNPEPNALSDNKPTLPDFFRACKSVERQIKVLDLIQRFDDDTTFLKKIFDADLLLYRMCENEAVSVEVAKRVFAAIVSVRGEKNLLNKMLSLFLAPRFLHAHSSAFEMSCLNSNVAVSDYIISEVLRRGGGRGIEQTIKVVFEPRGLFEALWRECPQELIHRRSIFMRIVRFLSVRTGEKDVYSLSLLQAAEEALIQVDEIEMFNLQHLCSN